MRHSTVTSAYLPEMGLRRMWGQCEGALSISFFILLTSASSELLSKSMCIRVISSSNIKNKSGPQLGFKASPRGRQLLDWLSTIHDLLNLGYDNIYSFRFFQISSFSFYPKFHTWVHIVTKVSLKSTWEHGQRCWSQLYLGWGHPSLSGGWVKSTQRLKVTRWSSNT